MPNREVLPNMIFFQVSYLNALFFLAFIDVELNRPPLLDSLYESVCAVPDLNEFLDNYSMEQSKLTAVHGQPGLPPSSSASSINSSSFMNGKFWLESHNSR